jgi:DNA helicase-2/ATP-dependent DNA helicase PcrA
LNNYLNNLNESQLKATLQTDGPMIVIAGAGSGKTRVLTYKIAHLMTKGVDPFNILALTFTNKAAREMKERISGIVGEEAKNLWMGTFHSVFAKILRIEAEKIGYSSNFTIYDTEDSQKLVLSVIKELNLDKEIYKYKNIYSRISSLKNSLITPKIYGQSDELIESDKLAKRSSFINVYVEYINRCFKAGVMDFDDLLLKTNELLSKSPNVLAKYQNLFKYILVDEYQDTNHSQYLIVKALSDKFQNICVVGDDAQSIYSFRGANIKNILNFQRDYHEVNVFRLEQNYRSTKNIVNAANSIIEKNENKLDKVVWTENETGSKINITRLLTDGEEGRFVASSIFESKMRNQYNNKDFVILYRTNAQSRAFEDSLRKKNIPYRVYGGLSFYQRKEIKDVLAYLRLIVNNSDEEAFKRIINFPARGIGQTSIDKLIIESKQRKISIYDVARNINESNLSIGLKIRNKISDFVLSIEKAKLMLKESNAFEITEEVIKSSGIYKLYKKEESLESINRIQNIEELLNGVQDFVDTQLYNSESKGTIEEFLQDVALVTDLDQDHENQDKVSLMTIHLAKGLEFPCVYIVGLEENLFPSAMNINSRDELEEERRLFYVALTRAQKEINISYVITRYRWGKLIDSEPSRFIDEIDEKYINILTPITSKKENLSFNNINRRFNRNKIRYNKPKPRIPSNYVKVNRTSSKTNLFDDNLVTGNIVSHVRFGKGEVLKLEGKGNDIRAEINFEKGGVKKLLLRFAKLKIIS